MSSFGTREEVRAWVDNMKWVDAYQRRHLRDGRSPDLKIRDAGELLELYLSFGYDYPDEDLAERAARSQQIQAGLAALST